MGRARRGALGVQADVLRAVTLPQGIQRRQDQDDRHPQGSIGPAPAVQIDQILRERHDKQGPQAGAAEHQAGGGAAAAVEPLGDQRQVRRESCQIETLRRQDAPAEAQVPHRRRLRADNEAAAHAQGAQRKQPARAVGVEQPTSQPGGGSVADQPDGEGQGGGRAAPAELRNDGGEEHPGGEEDAHDDHHGETGDADDDPAVVEAGSALHGGVPLNRIERMAFRRRNGNFTKGTKGPNSYER